MFGAIPAEWIVEIAKKQGYMEQLSLDLDCAPLLTIDERYLTRVDVNFDIVDSSGFRNHTISSEDHQVFTKYRKWLANNGYIDMVTNYVNGDSVLKPFYLNGMLFDSGDQFPCGSALGNRFVIQNRISVADS